MSYEVCLLATYHVQNTERGGSADILRRQWRRISVVPYSNLKINCLLCVCVLLPQCWGQPVGISCLFSPCGFWKVILLGLVGSAFNTESPRWPCLHIFKAEQHSSQHPCWVAEQTPILPRGILLVLTLGAQNSRHPLGKPVVLLDGLGCPEQSSRQRITGEPSIKSSEAEKPKHTTGDLRDRQ